MKAKELMIGDWVMNTYNRKPEQVCEIRERMVMLDYNDLYDYDEIEPIPLSDRILLKNGFQYFHKNYASLSYGHPFQIQMLEWPGEDGIGIWMVHGLKIRYVHELQHVLRMAEIDVKIRLED